MTDDQAGDVAPLDVTTSRFLDGRLTLRQPRRGHRAGTDAVLLAAAASVQAGSVFADVGAGVGSVGLVLALREPTARGLLVESSPESAGLARQNAVLNGLAARVRIEQVDIFDPAACRALLRTADLVVSNPPFHTAGRYRPAPDTTKAGAHVLSSTGADKKARGHGDWLRAAFGFLAPRGHLIMIHRPDALADLFAAAAGRLGALTVKPIHATSAGPAIRILLSGRAGSRAASRILAPLILHEADRSFTEEAEALHRGQRLLHLC